MGLRTVVGGSHLGGGGGGGGDGAWAGMGRGARVGDGGGGGDGVAVLVLVLVQARPPQQRQHLRARPSFWPASPSSSVVRPTHLSWPVAFGLYLPYCVFFSLQFFF